MNEQNVAQAFLKTRLYKHSMCVCIPHVNKYDHIEIIFNIFLVNILVIYKQKVKKKIHLTLNCIVLNFLYYLKYIYVHKMLCNFITYIQV